MNLSSGSKRWATTDGMEPVEVTFGVKEITTPGGYQTQLLDNFGHRWQAHVHFHTYEQAMAQMLKDARADVGIHGLMVKRKRDEVAEAEAALADKVIRLNALEEVVRNEKDVAMAKVGVQL